MQREGAVYSCVGSMAAVRATWQLSGLATGVAARSQHPAPPGDSTGRAVQGEQYREVRTLSPV